MIADALKFLTDLGTRSTAPVKIDGEPRLRRYVINGVIAAVGVPIPPRDHAVNSLEEIADLAERFKDKEDGTQTLNPVVWYSPDRVVLVLDDEGHRIERATLTLEKSDAFNTVVGLRNSKPWFEPKPFVRLLRIDLAGTLQPIELLDKVRRVKFEAGATTVAENRRDRESFGKEITSKVEAGGDIPEEVTLMVPVYKTYGQADRLPIRCAVEVDPARGAFQLLPLPDEIERTQHLAIAAIRDQLSESLPEGVPYYFGQP